MTRIFSRAQRGVALSFITTSIVLLMSASAVWAQNRYDAMQFPVSNTGAVTGTATASAGVGGARPFSGTGVLTQENILASLSGFRMSADELRALRPATGGVGIETVIGSDTRFRSYTSTYPARAVALITFDGGYCTGWFYGSNIVATAGHCVHDGAGGNWKTNVRVYPGYDAGSAPYGSYSAKWLASVVGWTQNGDERYDYGVVKLNTRVGDTVGWFGVWWQSASLDGTPTVITGYPGDKSPTQSQWIGADMVRVTHDRQVFYKNDTFGGQSGSPVWQDRPPGSAFCSDGPCSMAIHAYGLHGGAPHSDHNHGTRIVEAVFNNLIAWRDAD